MDLGLSGRRALVCGASSGLGRAIARELAAEGARVVVVSRTQDRIARAAQEIAEETGAEVQALTADLSTDDGPRFAVEHATERLGGLDILVTNTGGPSSGPFEDHSPETWRRTYDALLHSVVELTRAVLPTMRAQRWGRIVNVTSISVKQPVAGLILSNTFRAGVTGFARTIANEAAADGITVNNVLPGYTRTDRLIELAAAGAARAGTDAEAVQESWRSQVPAGRLGEPDELAALTAFLCSNRAGYITGQSIAVDGGWIKSLL